MDGTKLYFFLGLYGIAIVCGVHCSIRVELQTPTKTGTSTTLHENTYGQTTLAIVRCVDDSNITVTGCRCNLNRTGQVDGVFDVWIFPSQNGTDHGYKAYFLGTAKATSSLKYDKVKSYTLQIFCVTSSGGNGETASANLEVDILPNQQPLIPEYPTVTTTPINASSNTLVGRIVYQVNATDPENDALRYSMTQIPDDNFLTIGASDGIIRTAVDTRKIPTDSIVCTVSVTDGKNTVNDFSVTIKFKTQQLKLWAPLDFEKTDKYLITCTVFDGFLSSEGDVLTVHVINVNEAPVFSATTYFCTLSESRSGVSTCHLGLTVTDPDQDAIPTLKLLPGNSSERFRYDRTADTLTFDVDYDVDKMPTKATITIHAMDNHGANSTAKIEVSIQDANDNTCDFGLTRAAQATVNQSSVPGTLISLSASDGDLTSPNNAVTYEMVSCLPKEGENYISVFGSGEIKYINLIPETEHGKSYIVKVRCKDGGTPPRSATPTVQISYLTTPTTTTTTTSTTTTTTPTTTIPTTATEKSVWDIESFVAVFSLLMVLTLALILLGVWYFCCKTGRMAWCMHKHQQPMYDPYPYSQRTYHRPRLPRQVRPADEYIYDGRCTPLPPLPPLER
ncbi:cadherin EGF LAG seven-pass G-type receptor 1-like isoform X2 [Littorina saxatilis]|uniref:cadherin EGF LAG seven-pass G-type receptor 1-like isoform X2 n=1 Tax=Littorina saxatilis TaxID=31220 RepID=UPI0038B60E08